MRLQQNVVIVSGAARGICAAEARALVEHGARVVIGDLLGDLGRTLASELDAGRPNACAQYRHLAATRLADWEHAVRFSEESFGRLTTLVNNPGVHGRLDLEETSEDEWHPVLDADLKSAWLGMKACTPGIRRAGGGAIVNTSSVYGLVAAGAATAYHGAKGGVLMLSKAAAVKDAPDNIRVNCGHPGFIDTPMSATLPVLWKESMLA